MPRLTAVVLYIGTLFCIFLYRVFFIQYQTNNQSGYTTNAEFYPTRSNASIYDDSNENRIEKRYNANTNLKELFLNKTIVDELIEGPEHPLKREEIMEVMYRFRRWKDIPVNGSLHNPPPENSHFRLVFGVSADVSQSETRVPRDVATTLLSLSLFMKNYNFLPVLFTISKPLITLATVLNIPYYFGYEKNRFYMPTVDAMFHRLYRDVQSDYYGIINGDILIDSTLFHVLDVVDDFVQKGRISSIRSIAGIVIDIAPIDLISMSTEGMSVSQYHEQIRLHARGSSAYRHYCSADYFIFSRSTPLSVFAPFVLGRYAIDNFLLSRMQDCNGTLVDSTFVIPALHQGNKTNVDKVRKRAVLEGDLPYNQNLMKEQNISKGCLVNNAGVVLFEKDQEITITHWDSNKKKAIEQFKSFQQLVKYCLCFLMKLLH